MFDRNQPDRYQAPGQSGDASRWPAGAAGAGAAGEAAGAQVVAREGFLTWSFLWMFLALLASALAAAFVLGNEGALRFVTRNYMILLIAELGLVFVLSLAINRIGAIPGLAMLFAYALLNGATLAIIALVYTQESILSAFLGSSAIFGGAALYGVVTRRDLTSLGGILFMGLIGLIAVSIVNIFLASSTVNWVLGIAGVVIFTGLTAYDVQRINNGALSWIKTREGASVIGALHLYLDFINLFLSLLRIFGSRR